VQVCIDIQATIGQRAGIGRYALRLVQHLAPLAGPDRLRLAYFDFKRRGMPCPVPGASPAPFRLLPGRAVQYAWKTIRWPPFDALFGRADVTHFPNYVIPPLRSGRTVATIHDLTHVRFPHCTEDRNRRYLDAFIPDTLRRADVLLTVSRCIAEELVDTFHLDPARVVPIHHGIDPAPADDPAPARARLRALGVDRPYLLMVGTLEPRKNIPFLVEIFERLTEFDGLLVLAGMPGWKTDPILARIRSSPRASAIRTLRFVDDTLLQALYADAELFIFPSFYEGFGLTPLEAMQAGTPVVASAGGSLPEVLGDAALFPGAFDAERWAAAVRDALTDSALRDRLKRAGRARAALYTWDATAQRTWEVYRSL
jgi:glycosyltransferase involved in cell wall biosynthesis